MTITDTHRADRAAAVRRRHRHPHRRPHQGLPGRRPRRRRPRPHRSHRGEIFGLLGPNGAGKTTTAGMLTTRVIPTAGHGARRRHRRRARTRPRPSGSSASCPRPTRSTARSPCGRTSTSTAASSAWAPGPRRPRPTRLLEQFRLAERADAPVDGAVGRHGAAADGGPGGHAPAVDPVPRRADRRPRPAEPHRAVGDPRRAPRRRPDDPAHHALHGGGRPALRPGRHHRPGPHRRPRHAGRASSARSAPTPPCTVVGRRRPRRARPRCCAPRSPARSEADASSTAPSLLGVRGHRTACCPRSCTTAERAASPSPTSRSPRPTLETVFINLTGKDLRE